MTLRERVTAFLATHGPSDTATISDGIRARLGVTADAVASMYRAGLLASEATGDHSPGRSTIWRLK